MKERIVLATINIEGLYEIEKLLQEGYSLKIKIVKSEIFDDSLTIEMKNKETNKTIWIGGNLEEKYY